MKKLLLIVATAFFVFSTNSMQRPAAHKNGQAVKEKQSLNDNSQIVREVVVCGHCTTPQIALRDTTKAYFVLVCEVAKCRERTLFWPLGNGDFGARRLY